MASKSLLLNLHHRKTWLYDPVKACDHYLQFLLRYS